jgi:D-sedoheptulose 7-phosphate isomerase
MGKIKKPTEALILAGGLGTRLRTAVPGVPKPMAPVGGRRPFLEHVLDYWLAQGIGRFVLSVGHLADRITGHFGNEYRGAPVGYVIEKEPLGTGGALALAFRQIAWRGESILLLNGDTWLAASLDQLVRDARQDLPVTMVLKRVERNDRYGGVELDAAGRITRFGAAADGLPALVNAGCCLLRTEEVKQSLSGLPPKFSLEWDWLAGLVQKGLVGSSLQDADFVDIGVPEDYQLFCQRFIRQAARKPAEKGAHMNCSYLGETAAVLRRLAESREYETLFLKIADLLWEALKDGKKILFAGNGGSAADCQHLAGELLGRFLLERPAMPGVSLTVNTSVLTAILNDYGPEKVFSRQVEGLGTAGDVLWAFSTSGNSENILHACNAARERGLKIVGFTGEGGGKLAPLCDLAFRAPSEETPHIQECHIAAGHLLCGMLEERWKGTQK